MATEIRQIQVRRDTAANWTSENPTLASGEIGFETDTGKFKIGDGSTAWTAIADYFEAGTGASIPFNAASAAGPASLDFHEDTDNGSNRIRVIAPSSCSDRTQTLRDAAGTVALTDGIGMPCELVIACSDEATDLSTGTAKVTFRMPYAMTLNAGNAGVRASVNTAPTGATIIVDINEDSGGGSATILSTKLSIDASEKTSLSAATPAVISDTALAEDAEITIDIDQVGSTIPGKGLKVILRGVRV